MCKSVAYVHHICTTLVPQGGRMAKAHVNMRLDAEVLEALGKYAQGEGISRTEAVERLLRAGMAHDGPTVEKGEDSADSGTTEHLQAIVDVLKDSNKDLRATLTAQLAVKDAQIARAHDLADHAQALHLQAAQAALPEHRPSLWERMTGRARGEQGNG